MENEDGGRSVPVGTQLAVQEEASESGKFQADITGVPAGKKTILL